MPQPILKTEVFVLLVYKDSLYLQVKLAANVLILTVILALHLMVKLLVNHAKVDIMLTRLLESAFLAQFKIVLLVQLTDLLALNAVLDSYLAKIVNHVHAKLLIALNAINKTEPNALFVTLDM